MHDSKHCNESLQELLMFYNYNVRYMKKKETHTIETQIITKTGNFNLTSTPTNIQSKPTTADNKRQTVPKHTTHFMHVCK